GANNVGGVEFGLRYDGNLVDVVDVVEGPFMASPALNTHCERSADTTHFGPDVVQYGCFSTNTDNTYTGASGGNAVATITFHPKATGVLNLVFVKTELADPGVVALPVSSTDGVVNIVDPGQTGGPLQPTPTANPSVKTPTSLPT